MHCAHTDGTPRIPLSTEFEHWDLDRWMQWRPVWAQELQLNEEEIRPAMSVGIPRATGIRDGLPKVAHVAPFRWWCDDSVISKMLSEGLSDQAAWVRVQNSDGRYEFASRKYVVSNVTAPCELCARILERPTYQEVRESIHSQRPSFAFLSPADYSLIVSDECVRALNLGEIEGVTLIKMHV